MGHATIVQVWCKVISCTPGVCLCVWFWYVKYVYMYSVLNLYDAILYFNLQQCFDGAKFWSNHSISKLLPLPVYHILGALLYCSLIHFYISLSDSSSEVSYIITRAYFAMCTRNIDWVFFFANTSIKSAKYMKVKIMMWIRNHLMEIYRFHKGMIEVWKAFRKQLCYGATVWILLWILIFTMNVCIRVYLVYHFHVMK